MKELNLHQRPITFKGSQIQKQNLNDMKTRATKENVEKYYNILLTLYNTLQLTNSISMMKFSEQHNVTKNLSTVLKSGGIIRLEGKSKGSKWYWNTIPPSPQMALETLKKLGKLNPPRKKANTEDGRKHNGGHSTKSKKTNDKRLNNLLISKEITILGLFKIKVKYNYK